MRFSVIIPAFNRGYILAEAIESVLAQTYPDFEAIIVDDGSTDNTAQVASNTGDSRVRVIRRAKNAGVAAARNLGMDQAQGELISFLDSDDLWNPDKLAVESAFLDKHAEVDAAFTDVSKIHGELRIHSIARTCPVFHEFLNGASSKCGIVVPRRTMYLSMLQEMPIKIQATTFRQKSLQADWRFQESWKSGEDWEFLLRFARGHSFGFIDRPLVTQRIMSDSTLGRHEKTDALMLATQFIREKHALLGDPEAVAAVRKGIAIHSNRLGHCYLNERRTLDSAAAYFKGFFESRDLGLLARAPAAFLPTRLRSLVKRFLR